MESNDAIELPNPSDSRREFMKKGLLAAGAVGLGVAGVGTAAAQDGREVLVYFDDYVADARFRVVSLLPASITVRMLSLPGGGEAAEISQPDDYNGYAIRYDRGTGSVAGASYVFTKGTLRERTRYEFARDATVFSSRLGLLDTTVSRP
ncbi:hypothetical protein ZOD2009_10105 [Haladaptatus paucihalophilus DX253]|uniref:Tat (Twin-arginine translocation) pathway signal sequence n=1 Tax=Haladaptatus paucihalophilus DX253 TaxID=797209 RepID=E7QT93_HALPU|nr:MULTISPECIES: hypothetical protein [Haladaptatus]EFW91822.1 hypothetical protein ZOD2009_10105 [Haladaptatus paucihalophilus DX253]GKZ13989.1 hypothetical protein HAL_18700 [Haladaptatus sp. T7]SHK80233.1 hypothetical protein SAMN05444342_2224 [Haladaptatus paucihalophilus DX253]